MGLIYCLSGFWLHGFSTLGLSIVPSIMGIVGLPASHLMAFMYDNIQIILTGLYGASNFLKWYLYQPLLYPTLYPSIYLYLMPTTMPTFQTPKTYLHKILTKLLKIILKKFLKKKSQNVLQIKIYFLSLYC